jgi:hypothetical protein
VPSRRSVWLLDAESLDKWRPDKECQFSFGSTAYLPDVTAPYVFRTQQHHESCGHSGGVQRRLPEPDRSPVSQLQYVSYKNRPPCFAFRLQGAATRTFGVISDYGLADACRWVLQELILIMPSASRMTGSDITHVLIDFRRNNKMREMGPPGRTLVVIGSTTRRRGWVGSGCRRTQRVRISRCRRVGRIHRRGVRYGSVIGPSCCLPAVRKYCILEG